MATISINIDFKRYTSHPQLVLDLSPAFAAHVGDTVDFQIILIPYATFLYSDFLTLVSSCVIHLRSKGIKVSGIVTHNNDSKTQYASRVNFFQLIGLQYEEKFERKPGDGKFTEITPYDKDTFYSVSNNLRRVVIANINVDKELQALLDYCLSEIMDNALNHSDYPNFGKGKGIVCAQLFPVKQEIRLMICDTGVGIHTALTAPVESKYKLLSDKEAIALCTEKGVTNGSGLGFGLYASSEFIKENGGDMIVYSGNHYSHIFEGNHTVNNGEFWHGTFIFMRINTNISVDYKRIMPEGHTLLDDYNDIHLPNAFGIDEELW
ncbi:ATP-binding protein [Niabella pedocola]|uniref:ATP-binding protein n=1 Tax=Niabella pedocola TaxID=1752077 RepID=A0ABS8PV29_9BACT|nr:ATP-binding protein [Niabella pedocola]MCD2424935.1 ATP-binding protein [Niabella pedocola]